VLLYICSFFQLEGYQDLLHFEAAGNILQAAFLFIWERAAFLESIRISGEIVNPASGIFFIIFYFSELVWQFYELLFSFTSVICQFSFCLGTFLYNF
jgi:hypothetical protein